jgi:hypothetical protein
MDLVYCHHVHRVARLQSLTAFVSGATGRIHVRNPSVLGHEILHKYFRHSKYSSFQRQLNYFGFRKTQGKGKMSACTYTNIQLHGGSLKSLLGCKRKTSSVPRAGSDDEEREERDDLMSDDESDSGPVLTQPLSKRQRSMSAASAAESVSTSPDSILDNLSVKSDDESSDSLSFSNSPARPVAQPKRSVCIVVPPAGGAGNAEGTICVPAPSATLLPVTGAVCTPRGAIGAMEHFFDKDYMSLGSALPSPRGADDLFRCGTGLFIDDDEGENAWAQPPVQGSLGSLDEPQAFELDYGNDLAWSDTDSSDTAPESNKDAFWYLLDGSNNHVHMA